MLRQWVRPLRASRALTMAQRSFSSVFNGGESDKELLPSTKSLVDGILAGNRTALSRAITLGERCVG